MSKDYMSRVQSTPADMMYLFFSPMIQDLEGKMLTFIDASIQDSIQRKALKDLVRPMIWSWAIDSNMVSSYNVKMRDNVKTDIAKAL